MTKQKLNELIDGIISIRDSYTIVASDRKTLADACNLIEDNIDALAEDEPNEAIEILQEVNRNLLIRKENAERALRRIRFEVEDEADYHDAIVNADIAKGLYLALEIIDKHTKGGKE